MFSNQKNTVSQSVKIETLIGSTTNIIGNITSEGVIRIDGKLTGDINTASDVIVGETALINGNISAFNLSLSGKVSGNVKCTETLELLSLGSLLGDVEALNLSIDKGAIFNGKCHIISMEVKELAAPDEV